MTDKLVYYLDITGDVCPMTFVKTKLMIERMTRGQVCEVRLKGVEPLTNVPRSVEDMGDTVISLVAEDGQGADGIHRLRIVKGR
ncbi:MAG: sulfurtransferase TusA family protein [Alphaproteobacteria bacterium]|nr:sulfurtransferase TusA family protein [Alphaproteobacteria bacterium]